jgi:hypothetical protein
MSRRAEAFDLAAFGRALAQRDIARQLACYAPDADIRVVDPDNPPSAPRTVSGTHAISSWLMDCAGFDVDVTHLVDGGDRVAFTQGWHQPDGVAVVSTSTAELWDELIRTQHTILGWGPPPGATSPLPVRSLPAGTGRRVGADVAPARGPLPRRARPGLRP